MSVPPPTLLKKGSIKIPDLPEEVPIDYILKYVDEKRKSTKLCDKVLVLLSTTGTGKSAVLPPALYYKFTQNSKKLVAVTQPRVINAMTLPSESIIPYNKDLVLGENIGYKTGNSKVTIEKGILFLTVGSLQMQLSMLTDEEICEKYAFIIIDELHVTDMPSDLLQYTLKKFLARSHKNPNCPFVIVTSATIQPEKYMNYYNTKNFIKVEGFTYPIKEEFLELDSQNFIKDTFNLIKRLLKENKKEEFEDNIDILVFLPGAAEIESLEKELKELKNILLLVVDREAVERKNKAYEDMLTPNKTLKAKRKVILSTNLMETGVTIKSLKYVIDTGFYKSQEYNPDFCLSSLIRKPVPSFSYIQRRGRVGRRFPGNCFAMFTKETLNSLQTADYPDIYKNDITENLLSLLEKENISSIKDILDIDLLHRPAISSVWRSVETLYTLGFIDSKFKKTFLGEISSKINKFSIEQLKILFSGYVWKASIEDTIILVLSLDNLNKPLKLNSLFSNLSCCDFLTYIEQWHKAISVDFDVEKMKELRLDVDNLLKMIRRRDDLILSLGKLGFNPFANRKKRFDFSTDYQQYCKLMKRVLYEGLKLNLASWNGSSYITRTGLKINKYFDTPVQHFVFKEIKVRFDVSQRKINLGFTSVLDGFVIPDVNFF